MKTKQPPSSWLFSSRVTLAFALTMMAISSCRKDLSADAAVEPGTISADTVSTKTTAELTQTVPFPANSTSSCDFAPDYGTNLIQLQPTTGKDYSVSPLNNKGVSGTYLAWPGGLVIDAKTGAINVSRSETGAKYAVGFVRTGGADTCISFITLGGADYMDSVYSAATSPRTAPPHFNGDVGGPSPCGPGPGKCKFDYNHYAKNQGVYVDDNNGSIDINNTLHHSLFSVMPIDGTYFYSTIQYKVNDASHNAPQSIQVKFVYYNYRSSIPASLLQTVSSRANSLNTQTLGSLSTTRPPIIVITRYQ